MSKNEREFEVTLSFTVDAADPAEAGRVFLSMIRGTGGALPEPEFLVDVLSRGSI